MLPPGQQLAAAGKWPLVGERERPRGPSPWTVSVTGCVQHERSWTLDELAEFPQSTRRVDIHCVTRWSMLAAEFSGVLLQELLDVVSPTSEALYLSFVSGTARQHSTSLPLADALELGTLIATSYAGRPLADEHGGPVRTIVPNRYFYKSLKWLVRIDVLSCDRLGFWEATAGYHNRADPWREERFVASRITRSEAARILVQRNIAHRDLLGLDAVGRELNRLDARGALLRNANFAGAQLNAAQFDGANLSNASFRDAALRQTSFRHADLEGADFAGADLAGADLRGASLLGASFVGWDPIGEAHPARFDSATRITSAQLAQLLPQQGDFVRQALAAVAAE